MFCLDKTLDGLSKLVYLPYYFGFITKNNKTKDFVNFMISKVYLQFIIHDFQRQVDIEEVEETYLIIMGTVPAILRLNMYKC